MAYKPNIDSEDIVDATIAAVDLAAEAVDTAAIAADAVTTVKIAAAAVTNPKLAPGAVSSSNIGAGQVIASHMAVGSVGENAIQSGAVSAGKIAANAVTSTELAANAVTTAKIANSAVTSAKVDSTVAKTNAVNTFTASQTINSNLSMGAAQPIFMNGGYLGMFNSAKLSLGSQTYAGNGSNVFLLTDPTETLKFVTTTGGATTLRLPASHTKGSIMWIKDVGGVAGTNPITVDTADGDTIDGATSIQINTNYGSVGIVSNGTNWYTI